LKSIHAWLTFQPHTLKIWVQFPGSPHVGILCTAFPTHCLFYFDGTLQAYMHNIGSIPSIFKGNMTSWGHLYIKACLTHRHISWQRNPMTKIIYNGPGNSWNVVIEKSVITNKHDQIGDVSFRTAITFFKTHTQS
jgi:hypothetical protein